MLCVEPTIGDAAEAVVLQAGQSWSGSQIISVRAPEAPPKLRRPSDAFRMNDDVLAATEAIQVLSYSEDGSRNAIKFSLAKPSEEAADGEEAAPEAHDLGEFI